MPGSFPPLVVGSGPAGLALALRLAARGLRPTLLAPGGLSSTEATLCAFADEVEGIDVPGLVRDRFERVVVDTGAGCVDIQRPYVRLEPAALCAAARGAVDVLHGEAVALAPGGRAVVTRGGREVAAAVVVDATGHGPSLVRRTPTRSASQTAFGLFVEGVDEALPPGTALFMDWSAADADDGPPIFLYALAFADGRLLFEETSLAAWCPVPAEVLQRRLHARLRRRGTRVHAVLGEEHVRIPMTSGLPLPGQPVAAFGAALGLVQPITGYSVARALRAAADVAAVIADGVDAGHAPVRIADAVRETVWTPEARARRSLQLFGLDALCGFGADDARAFFAAFFSQPAPVWWRFLDGTLPAQELRAAMLRLFSAAPAAVRLRLLRGAFSPAAVDVVRDLFVAPSAAPGALG